MEQWSGDRLWTGVTTTNYDHSHEYETNASGDGVALANSDGNHQHNIVKWDVEMTQGHVHGIPNRQQT